MKEWFTIPELATACLPDLPQTVRGILDVADRFGWQAKTELARKAQRRGGGWEYHLALLPDAAQARLQILHTQLNENLPEELKRQQIKDQLWARYNSLSNEQKTVCEDRLNAILLVEKYATAPSITINAAAELTALEMNVSVRTIYNWLEMVRGYDRDVWKAVLAPADMATSQRSDCHEQAWEYIKSDYLRPEKPAFSACYRRLVKVAKKEKWEPVPTETALRRRLNAEVPKAVQVLARDGKDKAKTLFPAQRRTRSHLHAMQAVNMDGHKIDVFVLVPGIEKPVRMILLGIQDLFSGKLIAWRLTETECKEAVRLVIGDMVEMWGIPERITLDNGRAFASKWITGGSKTRYRFKVRDEDPLGLLTTLGIDNDWTQPYSGQSKPIERTWRDLAEIIAKHPFCSGAYTGNKPDAKPENYMTRAIPLEEFRMHVAAQIAEHNAQVGRSAENCKGRSFDETFEVSLNAPSTIVRNASASQRALWLLASEAIRAQKGSGEIHFHGNRYWNEALNQYAGKKVTIRFDPDKLHDPVKVYDLDNRLICEAHCYADVGYHSAEAARTTAKARGAYLKAKAIERKAHASLSAKELADIYYKGEMAQAAKPRPSSKVTRLVTDKLVNRQAKLAAIDEDTFEDSFSKAVGMLADNASIIPFPTGNTDGDQPVSIAYGSTKKGRVK